MNGGLVRLTTFLGRVCLALIFFVSAAGKMADYGGTVGHMTEQGLPMAKYLLAGALVFEIAGGLMVLFGWRTRFGALLLVLFLIPTTLVYHDFWAYTGVARTTQTLQFLKNLAIIGGLLMVCAYGSGPLGLDGRRRR
jgi:putative oxidoreductase